MVIRLALNKNNQKVVEEQAVWRGTNCYIKISLISLKVSSTCTVQQYPNAVFFNHFAAAEPFVNGYVAHGTQYNDPSVYIATTNRTELWSRISSQAISFCFGGTPGSHSRNIKVPRNQGWKTLP